MTDHAVMGQYVRAYKPQKYSGHKLVNSLLARPREAFPLSAVIAMHKEFPDVSFYQGNIDWDVMRSKTDTVIIRSSQATYEDPQFRVNWAAAKQRGMLRGAYHFYDDRYSPGEQAQKFYNLIRFDMPELHAVCDWENTYGGAFGGLRNVVAFMQEVERLLPSVKWAFYTGFYWFVEHSNAVTNAGQYNYLRNVPLWLGWYTAFPSQVRIPAPWADLRFWQDGTPAVGHDYGVETAEIDHNWFNGQGSFFYELYGGESTEQPPTTEEPMPEYFKVTAPSLNIRGAGNASAVDLGDFNLLQHDIVEAGAAVNLWRPILHIWRNGQAVPFAPSPTGQYWAHGGYMTPITFTPPEDVYLDYIMAHFTDGTTKKYVPE